MWWIVRAYQGLEASGSFVASFSLGKSLMPVHWSLYPLGSPISDIWGRIRFTFSIDSSCITLLFSKLQENKRINKFAGFFLGIYWFTGCLNLKYSQMKGRSMPIFGETQKLNADTSRPAKLQTWWSNWKHAHCRTGAEFCFLSRCLQRKNVDLTPKLRWRTAPTLLGPWTSELNITSLPLPQFWIAAKAQVWPWILFHLLHSPLGNESTQKSTVARGLALAAALEVAWPQNAGQCYGKTSALPFSALGSKNELMFVDAVPESFLRSWDDPQWVGVW